MSDLIKIVDGNIIGILKGGGTDIGKPFGKKIYLVDAHIAGTSHVNNIKEIEPTLITGKRLNFFREPDNKFDKLAIIIKDENGNRIGYVPRVKNEILSRLMDAGKLVFGTVFAKEFQGDWLKVTVQIYLDD